MQQLFSPRTRLTTWRLLWLWLAESEKELGLAISDEAIAQLRAHTRVEDPEFAVIAAEEKRRRHDVMAAVHAYGLVAPAAAGILHWGATSCYVTDNADLIFLRDGLTLVLAKLARVVAQLRAFALQYKDLPCLAYTHGQAALPTTVGKRACLWLQDLLLDVRDLERARADLRFRGVKGTTGSQASFLAIFAGAHHKVEALDALVTRRAGFASHFTISSQTYSRHLDMDVLAPLAKFGATCERIAGDIRHLAAFKELEEPFERDQIGSSAMAFKRNPMRSERLASLGRNLRHDLDKAMSTYAAQWFERSLDDSAIRRICLPDAFLGADACALLLLNITAGLVVYEPVIRRRLADELPFMASEGIMMAMVDRGASRQEVHEEVRVLSHQAAARVKQEGLDNDLIERIRAADFFAPIRGQIDALLDPKTHIGRAPEQVVKFTAEEVDPLLERYAAEIQAGGVADLKV